MMVWSHDPRAFGSYTHKHKSVPFGRSLKKFAPVYPPVVFLLPSIATKQRRCHRIKLVEEVGLKENMHGLLAPMALAPDLVALLRVLLVITSATVRLDLIRASRPGPLALLRIPQVFFPFRSRNSKTSYPIIPLTPRPIATKQR